MKIKLRIANRSLIRARDKPIDDVLNLMQKNNTHIGTGGDRYGN